MGNTWKHHLLTRFWLLLWLFPNGFDTCWCFSGDFQTEMCSKREVALNDDCWIHDSATPCKPTLKFKKCVSFVLCRLSRHSKKNNFLGTGHLGLHTSSCSKLPMLETACHYQQPFFSSIFGGPQENPPCPASDGWAAPEHRHRPRSWIMDWDRNQLVFNKWP